MSFWDMFKPTPTPTTPTVQRPAGAQNLPPIELAHKPGTLYYLRARNIYNGFDETLCFDSEIMRDRYISYARVSTGVVRDWYFDTWKVSAEERLQESLTNQREALKASYEKDIQNLQYKVKSLQADCNSLKSDAAGYKQDYLQEYHKYNELIRLIEKVKAEKEKQAPAAPASDTKSILQAIQKDLHTILCKASPELLEQYASEYQSELDKLGKHATPLQRGLTLAIIARQLNNI